MARNADGTYSAVGTPGSYSSRRYRAFDTYDARARTAQMEREINDRERAWRHSRWQSEIVSYLLTTPVTDKNVDEHWRKWKELDTESESDKKFTSDLKDRVFINLACHDFLTENPCDLRDRRGFYSEMPSDGYTFKGLLTLLRDRGDSERLAMIAERIQVKVPRRGRADAILEDYFFEGFAEMLGLDNAARIKVLDHAIRTIKYPFFDGEELTLADCDGQKLTLADVEKRIARIAPGLKQLTDEEITTLIWREHIGGRYEHLKFLTQEKAAKMLSAMPPCDLRDQYRDTLVRGMTEGMTDISKKIMIFKNFGYVPPAEMIRGMIEKMDDLDQVQSLCDTFGYHATTEERFPVLDRALKRIVDDAFLRADVKLNPWKFDPSPG